MALVPLAQQPLGPISPKEAITDLTMRIEQIRRKTDTLIDYYIYPEATPSEIAAYDPRLAKLAARLDTLGKLNHTNLAYLVDTADALVAAYINDIIDQLLNAVHGIQGIFQNHYDRHLEERQPFVTIYKVLEHREKQLKELIQFQMTNPRQLRPEDLLRPNTPGSFCSGAMQMANGRDKGKLSFVDTRELLDENRARLASSGGAFLWWECPECDFRVRYHITASVMSNIHSTDETREHRGCAVEYKTAFLVKCHVFQPRHNASYNNPDSRPSLFSRRSSRFSVSGPGSTLASGAKYGCVFCFANGKQLARTGENKTLFPTGRDLAMHISEKHRKTLPPSPMLQKFNVAINGKQATGVRRWDVNLK